MARNSQESRKNRLKALENAHGAMGCFLYMTLLVVSAFITISAGLFFAEKLFPRYIHVFNYNLSTRTFVELKSAHKYKAAVDFYEQKHDLFTTKGDKYVNMIEVFDCYKRIGEYEQAEAILRDAWDYKYLTDDERDDLSSDPIIESFFRFGIAREFFNLYEEMGDENGQKEYYNLMKSSVSNYTAEDFNKAYKKYGADTPDDLSIDKLMRLYDLKMLYIDDPSEAISGLAKYIKSSMDDDEKPNPSFILKCLNLYNSWIIEHYGVMRAYTSICDEVEYADRTDAFNQDKTEYGKLSDICFRVHDVNNSQKFYTIYTSYLKDNTSELDPLFINNQVRGFKFLENDCNWSDLEDQVSSCCVRLRELLSKNLYSMSESQREHFVAILIGPFNYASSLLVEHPSSDLAQLCFDNTLFLNGLLLRSNRELENKIKNQSDPDLLTRYKELQEYRKELSYRENLGKVGNSIRIASLKKKIEQLDKDLAVKCIDYKLEAEKTAMSSKEISKQLSKGMAAIEFIQTESDSLIALVLKKGETVQSVNLGSEDKITGLVTGDIRSLYTDSDVTETIWNPVQAILGDATDIFYSAEGVFNSISFSALCAGTNTCLMDKGFNFHLMSNLSSLPVFNSEAKLNVANEKLAIWGDVDYGSRNVSDEIEVSPYRDIERGEGLRHLIYSGDEVASIADIMKRSNSTISFFSGKNATESSFKSRSGKGDNILHVSTHGFFHEDESHSKDYNPMYNSGLLFAGADSTWNRINTVFTVSSMVDDGILRSDEIQYLDFSNCSLVVLSACKTGLGQSKNSEGVFGLQRAFKLAGAEKILMSLWNVDDQCTADLMKEFYKNLAEGKTYEEALRNAQSAVRKEYQSPEYWGAFILLN